MSSSSKCQTRREVGLGAHPPKAYVIVCFEDAYLQPFRNSIISQASVVRNYSGQVLGTACVDEIKVLEGFWPPNRSIAVFLFESMRSATMWYFCCPDVKQPDWLGGADIVAVPCKQEPPSAHDGMLTFSVVDLTVLDAAAFYDEYVPAAEPVMADFGCASVAGSHEIRKYRGLWDPGMVAINQWRSADHVDQFYNSEKYEPLKKIRHLAARTNMIAFDLVPPAW